MHLMFIRNMATRLTEEEKESTVSLLFEIYFSIKTMSINTICGCYKAHKTLYKNCNIHISLTYM